MKVGKRIYCDKCGRIKAPRGRSVPPVTYSSYCTFDQCGDYYNPPLPGDLWAGETAEEFGYPCSIEATEEI